MVEIAGFPTLFLAREFAIRRRIDPSRASNGASSRFLLTEKVWLGIQRMKLRKRFDSKVQRIGSRSIGGLRDKTNGIGT